MYVVDWFKYSKNSRMYVKNDGASDIIATTKYVNKDAGIDMTIHSSNYNDFRKQEDNSWRIPGNCTYPYVEWYCGSWLLRCRKLFILTKFCESLNIPLKIEYSEENRVPLTNKSGKIYACYL